MSSESQEQVAEDQAAETGEAIPISSAYVAPRWATFQKKTKKAAAILPTTKPITKDNNKDEIIILDDSDDEEKKDDIDENMDLKQSATTNKDEVIVESDSAQEMESGHTTPAVESGLLASVSSPEPSQDCMEIVKKLAEDGLLSPLQLEGSSLAIQRHCKIIQNQYRLGFFLGDGAGIGKGRQIAAVLYDSLARSVKDSSKGIFSRRRHLWISVSRELIEDARRDLADIGCHAPVFDGVEALNSKNKGRNNDSGILFITYPFLVSSKGKRLEEIIQWLSYGQSEKEFDGCIVFDEVHKAKNLSANPPTATGKYVLSLQQRLPLARVLYCSATGVSDIKHMGYAVRLGLWGNHTHFMNFDVFRESLSEKGVGALELLALEMKRAGSFVARTLCWNGAEFNTEKITLSNEQQEVYDSAIAIWYDIRAEIKKLQNDSGFRFPKLLWSHYWSSLQRFARELSICFKIPFIVEDAKKQIESGKSVVIGLQSTGESAMQASLEEFQNELVGKKTQIEDFELESLLSTAKAIMSGFVRKHFPIAPTPPDLMPLPPVPENGFQNQAELLQYERIKKMNETLAQESIEPIPELVKIQQDLLHSISELDLPNSPLDDLIDKLGGVENVSEMTGVSAHKFWFFMISELELMLFSQRSGRLISNSKGKFKYVKRLGTMAKEKRYGLSMPISEDDTERVNINEKKKFMDGKKKVAIISDAASTGISLHAKIGSGASERRRVHYTIELPWAADKAIQQLGRTHRSGQVSAPIYNLVVTDLGGERRFAASVSKRMAGLGALTKGDRRAATGSDLTEFDIDSKFGRMSLQRLYTCLVSEPPMNPSKGTNQVLDEYIKCCDSTANPANSYEPVLRFAKECLDEVGIEPGNDRKNAEIRVFLNRIAALPVRDQNLLFGLFQATLDDIISTAKATGEFVGVVEDVTATSIKLASTETIALDSSSGASTELCTFHLDRGCSLESIASRIIDLMPKDLQLDQTVEAGNPKLAKTGIYISKNRIRGSFLVLFAERRYKLTVEEEVSTNNRMDYDPLGLMVVTRPNTGE